MNSLASSWSNHRVQSGLSSSMPLLLSLTAYPLFFTDTDHLSGRPSARNSPFPPFVSFLLQHFDPGFDIPCQCTWVYTGTMDIQSFSKLLSRLTLLRVHSCVCLCGLEVSSHHPMIRISLHKHPELLQLELSLIAYLFF